MYSHSHSTQPAAVPSSSPVQRIRNIASQDVEAIAHLNSRLSNLRDALVGARPEKAQSALGGGPPSGPVLHEIENYFTLMRELVAEGNAVVSEIEEALY